MLLSKKILQSFHSLAYHLGYSTHILQKYRLLYHLHSFFSPFKSTVYRPAPGGHATITASQAAPQYLARFTFLTVIGDVVPRPGTFPAWSFNCALGRDRTDTTRDGTLLNPRSGLTMEGGSRMKDLMNDLICGRKLPWEVCLQKK